MKKLYCYIEKINDNFWRRIVSSTYLNIYSLCAFRIVVGFFLLVSYTPNFNWIADIPPTFFDPPILSLANLFQKFPEESFFILLDITILSSLICLVTGIKARVSTIVYLLACIVGFNFQYSFGKIDHMILPYVLLGCMACSGWGRFLALVPDKRTKADNPARSLSLLGVLVGFAMFTAGIRKAIVWVDLDPSLNGFLGWSQGGIYLLDRNFLLAPYIKYFPTILLEIMDYSAVLFELSPLFFLLYSRRAWRIWLLAASLFHLANILLLNISFTANSLVYLAFFDFRWLYKKISFITKSRYFKVAALGIIFLLATVRAGWMFIPELSSIIDNLVNKKLYTLYSGIVIWCIVISLMVRSICKTSSRENYY